MERKTQQFYIESSLLKLAYKNNLYSILVNFTALLSVYYQIASLNIPYIDSWFYCTVFFMLGRLYVDILYRKQNVSDDHLTDPQSLSVWTKYYVLGVALGGISWAIIAVIALPNLGTEGRFLVTVIASALAGGATGVLAPSKIIGKVFIVLTLLPTSITLIFITPSLPLLGFLGAFFCIVMLVGHHNHHRQIVNNIELTFKNDDLVENLKEQNNQILDLNHRLENRVRERTADLEKMALTDRLTQLNNREGFLDRCGQLAEKSRSLKFYFFDLDRFKQINDSKGHEVGDLVLQHISSLLIDILPKHTVVGRWGGDEFVICSIDDLESLGVLASLYKSFSESIYIRNKRIEIRMTIGVTHYPEDVSNIEEAIHFADLAATHLKRKGERGGILRFNHELARTSELASGVINVLHEKKYGRYFHLEYQAIVNEYGAISAVEALVRLDHPLLGKVPPDEFISVVENTGHIMDFGKWVLETALTYIKELRRLNPALSISVNVSPIQLKEENFHHSVQSLLSKHDLPASVLSLEITESFLEDINLENIIYQIEALQRIGVNIHIDDFGTGYSSLTRLRTLPASTLKIDRSFVIDMGLQGDGLIRSIMSIAEQFNLDIIVEGVETEQQFDHLKALGCRKFQGFYFSRPIKDKEVEKMCLSSLPIKIHI
ncbi:putative bifunctional diguanylate cyclase/phosphodiesterase [Marinomonas sp. 2405UD68-3]|uniref:putative bifunctional diguanylate cyclase/phosphodiesterase n=1 Tax=Marinomonas sp. 2405UD68-3 TaxID=3391835 RepID=UPI0039C9796B